MPLIMLNIKISLKVDKTAWYRGVLRTLHAKDEHNSRGRKIISEFFPLAIMLHYTEPMGATWTPLEALRRLSRQVRE